MNWLTFNPECLHDQGEHADSLGRAGRQLEASYHAMLSPFFAVILVVSASRTIKAEKQ